MGPSQSLYRLEQGKEVGVGGRQVDMGWGQMGGGGGLSGNEVGVGGGKCVVQKMLWST